MSASRFDGVMLRILFDFRLGRQQNLGIAHLAGSKACTVNGQLRGDCYVEKQGLLLGSLFLLSDGVPSLNAGCISGGQDMIPWLVCNRCVYEINGHQSR